MSSYDERLAKRILETLNNLFPKPTTSAILKTLQPDFAEVPQDRWLLALDGLMRIRHIEGKPYITGQERLDGIIRLRITPLGINSLRSRITMASFYWTWLDYFGREFFQKRKQKILAVAGAGFAAFLAGFSSEAWQNWKHAAAGALVVLGGWAIWDFVRVPWLLQKEVANAEQPRSGFFTVVGICLVVAAAAGLFYLTSSIWMPKKHRYAIRMNNDYVNLTNAQHAFKSLAMARPNCIVRMTSPPENRQAVQILSNLVGDFCKLDVPSKDIDLDNDVLVGSVDDAVIVHIVKQQPAMDGFVSDLGNVLSIRLKHDLPAGSPTELIWMQFGRGYPWRKDTGEAGTVK
jgi:hypothetical protein